jgi:hypothetical protein
VVEDVDELTSETKPELVGELKLPLKRDISLPGSETPQQIALAYSRHALPPFANKDAPIEPSRSGWLQKRPIPAPLRAPLALKLPNLSYNQMTW